MAIEGTIRIHRSIGGTGAAFRVSFVLMITTVRAPRQCGRFMKFSKCVHF